MTAEQIDALIELLGQIRRYPRMYLSPLNGVAALNYVHGMRTSLHSLGLAETAPDAWWQAQAARGYKESAIGPLPQMQDRGLTDEQMADEILAIETDTWRIVRDRSDQD